MANYCKKKKKQTKNEDPFAEHSLVNFKVLEHICVLPTKTETLRLGNGAKTVFRTVFYAKVVQSEKLMEVLMVFQLQDFDVTVFRTLFESR